MSPWLIAFCIYMMVASITYEAIVREQDWVLCILVALIWPIVLFHLVYDYLIGE